MKTIFTSFFFLLTMVCMIVAGNTATAGGAPDKATAITVYSSPGLYPMIIKWTGEYSRLHPGQQIQVIKAEGSSQANFAAKSGEVRFISGDDLAPRQATTGWQSVVGREVTVPVMNTANPYLAEIIQKGISPEEFAASINLSGKQQWGTLLGNGSVEPVHYYIVDDPEIKSQLSGFLGSDALKTGSFKSVTKEEMAAMVRLDPYAIGFCRLTDLLAPGTGTIEENLRLLPIDKNGNGKLDYMEQIYDDLQVFSRGVWIGKYPKALTSDVFAVSAEQPEEGAMADFLTWVLTDGQQMMDVYGYSALYINERQTQLDKVSVPVITATPTLKTASYLKYALWGLVALIAVGFILDRLGKQIRKKQSASGGKVQPVPAGFDEHSVNVPKGIYFDKTHTWAFMEQDGTVKAGIDDFLRHVVGPVTRVEMKKPGDRISKGDPFLTIIQQGKKLVLYSPVSGTIKAQNPALATNPALLENSPYSDGWIYQVEPANWRREIQFLSMAESYRLWLTGEFSRLKDFLAVALRADDSQYAQVVLQDGGNLRENLLSELSPEVWEEFQTKFIDSCK